VIDVIMIAFGKFTDANQFPLVIWESGDELKQPPPSAEPQPQADPVSPSDTAYDEIPMAQNAPMETPSGNVYRETESPILTPYGPVADFDPFAWIFAFIGNTCLLLALLCGAFVALHVPGLIAAGLPDPSLAQALDEFFGYPNWPGLLETIGIWIATAFVVSAATFIILARRKSSIFHIVRAVAGIGGLLSSLGFLSDATHRVYDTETIDLFRSGQMGPALEMMFQRVVVEEIIAGLVIFILSVVLLAWPARAKPSIVLPDSAEQGD